MHTSRRSHPFRFPLPAIAAVAALLAAVLLPDRASYAEEDIKYSEPAIVKRCKEYPDYMLCRLLVAWEAQPDSQTLREEIIRIVEGQVPVEVTGPIAQCLVLSRTFDRGAATAALRSCLAAVEPDLSAAGELGGASSLDVALGMAGSIRPTGPKQGAGMSCGASGGGVNPWLAQESKPWDFGSWPHSSIAPPDDPQHYEESRGWQEYQQLQKEATQAWQNYSETLGRETDVYDAYMKGNATADELKAAKEATQNALNEANKAIEKRDQFEPRIVDGNDGVTPTDDGTAVARTVPGYQSACNVAAEFLGNCAATSWTTSPCQVFLQQLKGCDTTIMLIDPEQGGACGSLPASVDASTFDQVMNSVCWSRVTPAGPDQDPCAPASLDGAMVMTLQPNPCADPQAMINPEDGSCYAPYPDPAVAAGALLGTATLDDLIVEMEKLCNCDLPDLGPDTGGDRPSAFEPVGWSAKPAWSPIHDGEPMP